MSERGTKKKTAGKATRKSSSRKSGKKTSTAPGASADPYAVAQPKLHPGNPREVWEQLFALSIPEIRALGDVQNYPDTPSVFVIPARHYLALLLGPDDRAREEARRYQKLIYQTYPPPRTSGPEAKPPTGEGASGGREQPDEPEEEGARADVLGLRDELLQSYAAVWDRFEDTYAQDEPGALKRSYEEFARWYALTFNKRAAAELAGFGPGNADSAQRHGYRLYNRSDIYERIVQLSRIKGRALAGRREFLGDWVVRQLEMIAQSDLKLILNETGTDIDPRRLKNMSEGFLVKAIRRVEKTTTGRDGSTIRTVRLHIDLPDQAQALRLLAQHTGRIGSGNAAAADDSDHELPEHVREILELSPEEKEARYRELLARAGDEEDLEDDAQ